jgi:hypothetical protein
LLGAVIILALVVSAAGDETRTELDYVGQISDQATEIARSGDALRDVVSRLQRIDRTEFETVIEAIQEDLDAGLALVAEEPSVRSLIPVQVLYTQALESWDRGVNGFSAAVLEAADDPESVVVVDNMADSLAELRAGDNAYEGMLEAMSGDDVPAPLSPMPEIVMMPAEGSLVSLSVSYVDSARSENSELALRPGLRVSMITSDPEWQMNPEGQAVMPATESASFSVVVSNVGNVRGDAETLVFELLGGTETIRVDEEIDPLSPNQQVTVVLEDMAVEPGLLYRARAALAITGGDASFEDNEIIVEFTVNEE